MFKASILLAAFAVSSAFAQDVSEGVAKLQSMTSPVEIAGAQGYELPICNDVYDNENHWGEWSECSASCGDGVKFSYMNELGEAQAQNQNCEIRHRTTRCVGTKCPQDCEVTNWSEYGACDQQSGKKIRSRSVVMSTLHGGKECPALEEAADCPVDCQLTPFTEFGECDKHSGQKMRSRTVIYPTLNGGSECEALEDYEDCSVDCQEGVWGEYSVCDKPSGTKFRTRPVVITAKNGGRECATMDTVDCPVNCEVSAWGEWEACDKPSGIQERSREVTVTAKNGGAACDAFEHDTNLVGHQKCAVDCELTQWSEWGECNKQSGIQKREREVFVTPKNGGAICSDLDDYQDCTVHCEAGPWSEYGTCSKEDGLKWRTREVLVKELNSGIPCTLEEPEKCPVDAEVSEWGTWSDCAKYGEMKGTQYRERTITVSAKNGGAAAPDLKEIRDCAVHCEHDIWQEWSACNQVTGLKERFREILIHPVNKGDECNTHEEMKCSVDCQLEAWTTWGECDKSTGFQTRTRQIKHPPLNGGNQCDPLSEQKECVVHCEATEWSEYSQCFKNNGTQFKTRSVAITSKNGGEECTLLQHDKCAVNCELSAWGEWPACVAEGENKGTTTRHRVILVEPLNGGAVCDALSETDTCAIDCKVSEWGNYGDCVKETGLKWRERSVLISDINGGKPCESLKDSADCLVHCEADIWGDWTECSKTEGTRSRERGVVVTAKNDGTDCTLDETETCPISCELSEFGPFGECVKETGLKWHSRSVVVPPLNNGAPCLALNASSPCRVECETGGWLDWSQCDANGFQVRTKEITVYAKNGGSNDECSISEERACPRDCEVDSTGAIIQAPKNGGRSCLEAAKLANEAGAKLDLDAFTAETHVSLEQNASESQNNLYGIASLATGGMGVMLLAGLFVQGFRNRRRGYQTLARPVQAV